MSGAVDTKNPTAVAAEVQAAYLGMFPDGERTWVPRTFDWVVACFIRGCADYQAVDTRYHDLEHTLQGALCLARLLRGRQRAGAAPVLTPHFFELGLLAMLLHDTGYLKHRDDRAGTGAKYTVTHVARSAQFAGRRLAEQGFSPADIQAVQNMIHCTGVETHPDMLPFQSEPERVVGCAVATADLLGQMAADNYLQKLPDLYAELAEAAAFTEGPHQALASFASAEDVLQRTPHFWHAFVRPRLEREFRGVYRFLNDPYPDGPNEYLNRIKANLARLRAPGVSAD